MHDTEHKSERVKMGRWIVVYISLFGGDTPWIEGHSMIKKETLTFNVMFWWMLVRYRLWPTAAGNVFDL